MKKILYTLFFIFILNKVNCQIDTTIYEVKTDLYKTNTISGSLKSIEWESKSMQELRKISIYEPIGFHKDSTYNIVITTDGQCEPLANALESKIINNEIQPILIIGVHNREPQKIDSIFGGKEVDFRSAEMVGSLFSDQVDLKDSIQVNLLSNRIPKFQDFIVNEVSDYANDHYNVSDKSNWTIGGFSNGGFAVTQIGTEFPDSFGYIIVMSPAGGKENRSRNFDYSMSNLKFFICAGIDEVSFYKRSIHLANALKESRINFEHKTYKAGHDYNMWLTYYVEVLSKIYKTRPIK